MCIDRNVMICVGAATEVVVLKKALAEAEEKLARNKPPVRSSRPGLMRSSRSSRMP